MWAAIGSPVWVTSSVSESRAIAGSVTRSDMSPVNHVIRGTTNANTDVTASTRMPPIGALPSISVLIVAIATVVASVGIAAVGIAAVGIAAVGIAAAARVPAPALIP